MLLWLLCPRCALLDAVSSAVRHYAPGLLCVGVRLGGERNFPAHFASNARQSGRAQLPLPQGMARACVRRAAAGILLYLRGHPLQHDLVRHDDMALLLRHSRAGLRQWADRCGTEYAVVSHRRAVLCVCRVFALDGGLLLAGYLSGKAHLLVRYAADACHSGAAARHEKGGGRMTYIENIFLCMVSPLLVAALCMGRRQLRFFLFCIAGMGVCLISAYINTFLAAVCQADALAATAEIAPVVEEMMKLLPLVFYLLVFEPEGDKIKAAAITVALAFATFENVCYLIQNGADSFSFIFFRGFGTGAMHVLCGLIVGGGLAYTWWRTWLKIAGTCGLLGAVITLHAIYNLLIVHGGAAQYIAYALPVLLVTAGRLSVFRLSRKQ